MNQRLALWLRRLGFWLLAAARRMDKPVRRRRKGPRGFFP